MKRKPPRNITTPIQEVKPAQQQEDNERANRCLLKVNAALSEFQCVMETEVELMGTNANTRVNVVTQKIPLYDLYNRLRTTSQRANQCNAKIQDALLEFDCFMQGGLMMGDKGNRSFVIVLPKLLCHSY